MSLRRLRKVERRRPRPAFGWTLLGLVLGLAVLLVGISLFYRREGAAALQPVRGQETLAL